MGNYDADKKTYSLTLSQEIPDTPGQKNKQPMHIPVKLGLIGPNGEDIVEEVLHLKEVEQTFRFENIGTKPVPSILRGFSAPVNLSTDLSIEDLAFLMVHDNDGFNRWDAGQMLSLHVLKGLIDKTYQEVPDFYLSAFGSLLEHANDPAEDPALMARALSLPDFQRICQMMDIIDPQVIHTAREKVIHTLSKTYADLLDKIVDKNGNTSTHSLSVQAMGQRALKNVALHLRTSLHENEDAAKLYKAYSSANNMTDRLAAFQGLIACSGSKEREKAVQNFYDVYKNYPLVVDKWFSSQVITVQNNVFEIIESLRHHIAFNIKNPNRVRSLYAAFAMNNPVQFHDKSGRGYEFLKNAVIELNEINPMIAARLLTPVREWRRYTHDRQEKMKSLLEDLKSIPNISSNVFEIVSKSLNE